MPIILNNYSDTFEETWKLYQESHNKMTRITTNSGVRNDKVYIPVNIGSKETAYTKWKYLLDEVIIVDEKIDEQLLFEAVALYCHDRIEETKKGNYRLPMLATLLRTDSPDPNKTVEILDYIREAKRLMDKLQENANAEKSN
jgi:hypothetical protein